MSRQYPLPPEDIREIYRKGTVIPAHPLALTRSGKIDEKYQKALTRYYLDAGAGGLAVGVHTTGFPIHDPKTGYYRPVLELAMETVRNWASSAPHVMIAGICGKTGQAVTEAGLASGVGYHIGMVSLSDLKNETDESLISHIRQVARIIPVMGFYLQPSVGGRILSENFWRKTAEIPNLVGIKIAPFNRYHTLNKSAVWKS